MDEKSSKRNELKIEYLSYNEDMAMEEYFETDSESILF